MRLCDFCWSSSGLPVAASTQISFGPIDNPDEVYDACQSCAMTVKEMLNQPKKEEKHGPGRPRKTA
jgi:hypothetical protein